MSLTASGAHVDASSVTFTYGAGPTVLLLGEVENVDLKSLGTIIAKAGGNAPGPTHHKAVNQQRSVTLSGFQIPLFAAIPVGVDGVLAFILNDEHNGELTGALQVTLSNCMIPGSEVTAKYNEYAGDSVTFTARWTLVSNAYVDPLVVAAIA